MLVSINNAVLNNWIFIGIFLVLILIFCKQKRELGFSISVSQELKGFAILAIVFSHIGYFLVTDHQFLFPLSVLAGVGVNLFLFLSGYGLTISAISKNDGKLQFYKKRLIKLLVPFWIVLISFLLMDYFILGISYDKSYITKAILGIFTNAELNQSLNSPFWYITLILIYYLLFPLVFIKKYPWISALLLYFISYYFLIKLELRWFEDVTKLYKLHIFAFPLGVIFASIYKKPKILNNFFILKLKQIYKKIELFAYPVIGILLMILISYFAINSGVGETIKIEQTISLLTMFAIILLFLIKKFEFKLLSLFGLYSYELYLFHWPIMYRYEIFYKYFPAWLATILYLVLFICLAWVLQLISKNITRFKFLHKKAYETQSNVYLENIAILLDNTPMKLYNSLSREKEEFKPLNDREVLMYSCGPTVYQRAHIGNFRTYTMVDALHRVLLANKYKVKYITNITDVGHLTGDNLGDASTGEDKMELTAKKESKSIWDIANEYTEIFLDDYEKMNLLPPEKFPKATDHIDEQIKLIQELEKRGFTYQISDGIYFDTSKFPNYGELSNIDQTEVGGRLNENSEKKDKKDFALWKFNLSNERRQMEWDSPWGVGFPGWHIECSAMSMKYLGETLDIHCGGEDLKSTHHPNEIAQSEAVTEKTFSRFWYHVSFLLIDGKKMSKSLGNAYTLDQLNEKGFDSMVLKYFYYSGHYRKQINLTFDALESSKNALNSLREIVSEGNNGSDSDIVKEKYEEFVNEISDDVNTAKGLAVVWSIAKDKNLSAKQKTMTILECDKVLGLKLNDPAYAKGYGVARLEIPMEVLELGEKREEARIKKDWAMSDQIRDQINQLGFDVIDKDGTQSFKKKI